MIKMETIREYVFTTAGVLIYDDYLLNFIVAIYLIFVGLTGLGVLRMFHL